MKVILLLSLTAVTAQKSKIVQASGSLATNVTWDGDLNKVTIIENGYIHQTDLYKTTATQAKTDLENLLTNSSDVDSASVDITGFTEITATSETPSKARVNFEANLGVPESKTTDYIENSVTEAVEKADPNEFDLFVSFDDFSVTVTEEITEMDTESDTESNTESIPTSLIRSYGKTPSDELFQQTVDPPNRLWEHLSQVEDGKILIYWSEKVTASIFN